MRLGKLDIKRFLAGTEQAFERLLTYSNNTASFWIVILMLFIMSDVIGRSLFSHPIAGTAELVGVSVVGMVFLQVVYVLRQRKHIRSTMIASRFPAVVGIIIDIMAWCAGLTFCVVLVLSAWPLAWKMTRIGEYFGPDSFPVYTYHVRWIIVAAGILMGIQLLLNLFRSFRAMLSRHKALG